MHYYEGSFQTGGPDNCEYMDDTRLWNMNPGGLRDIRKKSSTFYHRLKNWIKENISM